MYELLLNNKVLSAHGSELDALNAAKTLIIDREIAFRRGDNLPRLSSLGIRVYGDTFAGYQIIKRIVLI